MNIKIWSEETNGTIVSSTVSGSPLTNAHCIKNTDDST